MQGSGWLLLLAPLSSFASPGHSSSLSCISSSCSEPSLLIEKVWHLFSSWFAVSTALSSQGPAVLSCLQAKHVKAPHPLHLNICLR
jgi:hypothetical protein